jgi:hypothetical protein
MAQAQRGSADGSGTVTEVIGPSTVKPMNHSSLKRGSGSDGSSARTSESEGSVQICRLRSDES